MSHANRKVLFLDNKKSWSDWFCFKTVVRKTCVSLFILFVLHCEYRTFIFNFTLKFSPSTGLGCSRPSESTQIFTSPGGSTNPNRREQPREAGWDLAYCRVTTLPGMPSAYLPLPWNARSHLLPTLPIPFTGFHSFPIPPQFFPWWDGSVLALRQGPVFCSQGRALILSSDFWAYFACLCPAIPYCPLSVFPCSPSLLSPSV